MAFELDHVFVCTDVDAPDAARLAALGLTGRAPRTHLGQGTANRCFVFHNAYLELIWVHAPDEARSPLTARTRLFERWAGRAKDTCPFGVCLRPARGATSSEPPFATWDYVPGYTTASNPIRIGANSDRLDEPMLFFLPGASRPDRWPNQPSLQHPLGVLEVTRVRWMRPGAEPRSSVLSPELRAVIDSGCLELAPGAAHALDLGFDHEATANTASVLPGLPLTLRW